MKWRRDLKFELPRVMENLPHEVWAFFNMHYITRFEDECRVVSGGGGWLVGALCVLFFCCCMQSSMRCKVYFSLHVIRLIYIHLTNLMKRSSCPNSPMSKWMNVMLSIGFIYILHCIASIVCIFKQPLRNVMLEVSTVLCTCLCFKEWKSSSSGGFGSVKHRSICSSKWGEDG